LISFICPTIRPENWSALRDQIAYKNYEFEIIFLGPLKKMNRIPKNCRYIRTFVKPSQCFQAGVLISKYNYIALLSDDISFNKENYLEEVYKNINLVENKKTILSFKNHSYGVDLWKKFEEYNYMEIPCAAVIKKSDFFSLGGIDSRFVAVNHDTDLYLRFLENGFKNIFIDIIATEHIRKPLVPSLHNKFSKNDQLLLKKLWFTNGVFNLKRKDYVKSYSADNLLDATVEPFGKWQNTSFIFNFFKYNFFYYLLIKTFTLDFNFIYNFYLRNKDNFFIKIVKKIIKG
jgi:hypothetical protein